MRSSVTIDDDLYAKAAALAALGGSEPHLQVAERRQTYIEN